MGILLQVSYGSYLLKPPSPIHTKPRIRNKSHIFQLNPDLKKINSLIFTNPAEHIYCTLGPQTKPDHVLKLYFDQARFPCQGQYARVRDGDSLIDVLLADVGSDRREPASGQVTTRGPRLLLEFFSEEQPDAACLAGFLAHVATIRKALSFFFYISYLLSLSLDGRRFQGGMTPLLFEFLCYFDNIVWLTKATQMASK